MGLTASISNALSGLNVGQKALEVVSRNVANSGTPGYHRQEVVIQEDTNSSASYARFSQVERAFSESLQRVYNAELSDAGYADVRASFLERIETSLGKPGDATSLDTMFIDFDNALRDLATSPDDFATRALVLSEAQEVVETLNSLAYDVQDLRRDTEAQLENHVNELNDKLESLEAVNFKLADQRTDATSRASLLDERDRLVAGIAELTDVRVTYKDDQTVALMTKSGLGLLDVKRTVFTFTPQGDLGATSLYNLDDDENGVGVLTAATPAGFTANVVDEGLIRSGRIAGLLELRDNSLTQLQAQIDEIAAGLTQALNTVSTEGTAVTVGTATGFEIDTADLQPGNELTMNYTLNGTTNTVRIVRVDDTSKLPMDYTGEYGERVIGIDFSGGTASAATQLQSALGANFAVSNPSGTTLQIVDNGVPGGIEVSGLSSRTTVTAEQGAGLSLNLFVDSVNGDFTNSLDGVPQKLGYAQRIAINPEILADSELLVKATSTQSLGDSSRVDYLVEQLRSTIFTPDTTQNDQLGSYQLSGNVQNLISQVLNFQGNRITSAQSSLQTHEFTLETIQTRIGNDYGVNVDEEMGRLIELQTAYSANARVISTIQDLMERLLAI